MGHAVSMTRRALLGAALGLTVSACAAHEPWLVRPTPRAGLVQLEVYDRTDGVPLAVHAKDGRRYIVGTPGHEYALRIRNTTGGRVLAVTSVDGVNVISGDTAAPSQTGYVLEPWGSVEIIGWRKSLERTAAFYFTEHRNSYAARTGRPDDVGVIGVAAFRERAPLISRRDSVASADERAREESGPRAPASSSKLGTGHGRDEASRVTMVPFERASDAPSQTVVVQYDRRENLAAMGVLPAPSPHYSRREPQPFPGVRFVPDP